MFAFVMLAAVQAVMPAEPAVPSAKPGHTVIREVVVHRDDDAGKTAGSKAREERREIVIIRDAKDAATAGRPERRIRIVDVEGSKPGEHREIRIRREANAPGARIAMLSCHNGAKVDSEATDTDGKKTRVMICAKGGSSNVPKAQQLRDAAKRIAADSSLSRETRTRVVLAINEAIAKLPVNE